MVVSLNKWVKGHQLTLIYVWLVLNVFLALGLYKAQTDARIEGDNAVTQAQLDQQNSTQLEIDTRNCLGGVDFRLEIIGLAEDILSVQVQSGDTDAVALLTTIRQRFSPPACVVSLGLDTDGDGWPEGREPLQGTPAPIPQPPPGTTIP